MADAAPRARVFRHPWRVVIVAIALFAVLNLGVILLANSDTSKPGTQSLPVTVESVNPGPGELTGLVDDVTIDLRDDLTGDMVIDGITIPEDQLERTAELGIITFRPGKGKELTKLVSGENTVVVYYWPRTDDRPEPLETAPGRYSWRFRAAA
ncbi:MAG: hypothetical protein ACHQIG_08030 [Acidimicrobiia bacterium]